MGKKDRKPYTWEVVQDFTDPETGITLRVSRNDASPPGYSWQQGNKPTDGTADERLRPFNRMSLDYATAEHQPLVDMPFDIVVGLMTEMKTWVELDAKAQVELLARKKKEDTKKKANAVNGPRPEVFGKVLSLPAAQRSPRTP
jgi:hypothetical protein